MTWFKVDDTFAMHPKAAAAGPALALWVRAGSWCAQQLTDGFVPAYIVPALGRTSDAKRLVAVGLWSEVDGGYAFHDWLTYQPSRAKVTSDRDAAAERKRVSRARHTVTPTSGHTVTPTSGHGVTDTSVTPGVTLPRPDPSRSYVRNSPWEGGSRGETSVDHEPAPDVPDDASQPPAAPPTPTKKRPKSVRATRLPDDWRPSPATHAQLVTEVGDRPASWWDAQGLRFADYWRAQGGVRGRKVDWDATWRNWIRRAAEDHAPRRAEAPRAGSGVWDNVINIGGETA